tara:strand:+ start:684 stop:1307 length:624 start_codon:yes stop_codon:yes gene_type:complete
MKLYSDEEANYLCRDFRDIPFELRQMMFDKILDDNHISRFNPAGKKKRDYSTPANINMFSEAVGDNYGIDSKYYRKEYNKIYDKNVKKKYNKVMEDRKRDDEITQYENIIDNLRKPNNKINEMPTTSDVEYDKMYSNLEKEFVNDAMDRAVNAISKITERKTSKGVDTSIVDAPTKAQQGQFRRRQRQREQLDVASVDESKNEEYQI